MDAEPGGEFRAEIHPARSARMRLDLYLRPFELMNIALRQNAHTSVPLHMNQVRSSGASSRSTRRPAEVNSRVPDQAIGVDLADEEEPRAVMFRVSQEGISLRPGENVLKHVADG